MGKFVGDGSKRGGSDFRQNEGQGGGVAAGRRRQTDEMWREVHSHSMHAVATAAMGGCSHAAEVGTA